ncbi:MAG: TatD family hydrolase [Candidatus Bathyarchaeota archaeon]|nr:TatD family hydrolase [Candidatus Bathyarchaeota archaeon]
MFSESHCHLRDLTEEALRKTENDGFTLLITSGIDLESSITAVQIAEKYKIVKASVGVHPWYANEYNLDVEARFKELATSREVVAISEIGLDYVGRMNKQWVREDKYIDKEIQVETLASQLRLARELGLPAIVHDRADGTEIIDMLIDSGNIKTGLAIHGFSKGIEYAKKCVDNGIFLSVGLRTIQAGDPEYLKAVKWAPMEYLLTETDSGTPQGVLIVCDLIAEAKGLSRAEVGEAATRNLMRLCNL